MIEELKKCFLDNWDLLGGNIPRPGAGDVLAAKTGDSTERTVRFHLFTRNASGPVCVAKLVRDRRNATVLQREYAVLEGLNRRLEASGPAADSIPRPLQLTHVRGEPVLLLAIRPGKSLDRLIADGSLLPFGQGKAEACMQSLRVCLESFQQCTKGGPASEDFRARKFDVPRIRAVWNGESGRVMRRLLSACDELGTIRFTPVACHGQLTPRCVTAARARKSQIADWDGYRESGHPLDDALDLVFSTAALTIRWQAKAAAGLFAGHKSTLQDACFSFISPFRQAAGLTARQTYLYMLLRAARGWERETGSRSERSVVLNLLRTLMDEEEQIVARLDGSAAA